MVKAPDLEALHAAGEALKLLFREDGRGAAGAAQGARMQVDVDPLSML
jgi:hypothetical protein